VPQEGRGRYSRAIVARPRMPGWFAPVWDWAGRADDALGRLRLLRNAAFLGIGVFVIFGILLINAFGPWGAFAFAGGAACACSACREVVYRRARGSPQSGGLPPEGSQQDGLTDEARALVQEMRAFYIEQREGLPPLKLVMVGSPPGALEEWQPRVMPPPLLSS